MKHTPGPWIATLNETEKSFRIESALIDHAFGRIATVHHSDEANARLIAAAPELLERVKRLEYTVGEPWNKLIVEAEEKRKAAEERLAELLDACKTALKYFEYQAGGFKPVDPDAILLLQEAISKAEGK